MPPAVLIPAVLSLPVAGDVRSPPPGDPARTAANGADPQAAQEFGRALVEAMQNPGKAPAQRSSAPAEPERDVPDAVPVPPGVVQDSRPPAGVLIAVVPAITLPTPVPAVEATPGPLTESGARAASDAAGAHAVAPPKGKTLPIADQALPRSAPAAPAPAPGAAPGELARPAGEAADPVLTSPLPAPPTAAVASTSGEASAAPEPSVMPGAAGAALPATDDRASPESAPGLREMASRRPPESAIPAPAGPAAAGVLPAAQAGLARGPDRAAAGTHASEATPRRAEAAVAAAGGGRITAASADAVEPAHGDAGARRLSGRPVAVPPMLTVPAGAADGGESAAQPHAPAAHDKAGKVLGVAMPVAMAVVPPALHADRATTEPLAAGAATRRQQTQAPALQAGHPSAPPAPQVAQGDARVADNATTPWLQALNEARELAAERGLAPPDGDATGASAPLAGERSVAAVPALQALAVAAARTEAGTGPAGVFAAPLAVGQAGAQWAGELEARVQWLAGRNLRSADIQLDPPELGPLQVQVHSHRDGASVHFTTHSATVRDLVEQSLPRLREMLENSGMNLLDVNVAQQQGGRGQRDYPVALPGFALAQGESAVPGATMVVVAARGLVDAYA